MVTGVGNNSSNSLMQAGKFLHGSQYNFSYKQGYKFISSYFLVKVREQANIWSGGLPKPQTTTHTKLGVRKETKWSGEKVTRVT